MSEEKSEIENPTENALQIIIVLLDLHTENMLEAEKNRLIESLQLYMQELWLSDESGKMRLECLNVLYDVVADNSGDVSPAIWKVLEIIDEKSISCIVDNFLNDSKARLKNVLCAIIDGLCQCGPQIPILQKWAFFFIDGLEEQENYSVLTSVSQSVISKLLQCLLIPHFRTLIYPVFERLLYPTVSSPVFHSIIEKIPDVVSTLVEEQYDIDTMACLCCLSGLVETLMLRFPPNPKNKYKYEILEMALSKAPDIISQPRIGLWNRKQRGNSELAKILECPVCYDRVVIPIFACENGHCICNKCRDELSVCPVCKVSTQYNWIRMTLVNQIMEMTKFPCKNTHFGCDIELLCNDIRGHEEKCEYQSVSCELEVNRFNAADRSVCRKDVSLANFHCHVEKYHNSYITEFELNKKMKEVLSHKKLDRIRVLKDEKRKLYFIERIYKTEQKLFFSYHYIGSYADGNNYIYTVKIGGEKRPNRIRYSHFCLPKYMNIHDTEASDRCLVLDPNKVFDSEQTEFGYSVKIEVFGKYRLRKIKRSCSSDISSLRDINSDKLKQFSAISAMEDY